jgi:hypothetical protein
MVWPCGRIPKAPLSIGAPWSLLYYNRSVGLSNLESVERETRDLKQD